MMSHLKLLLSGVIFCGISFGSSALAEEKPAAEKTEASPAVERALVNNVNPETQTTVTTKAGKLKISGLAQVWYSSIQNDNGGFFGGAPGESRGNTVGGTIDSNEVVDNDSFSLRRFEIKFTTDIHENIRAAFMIEPTASIGAKSSFSSNLGTKKRKADDSGSIQTTFQTGSGSANKLLSDAFIEFHGLIPHHNFKIGQYKPVFGYEGIKSSAKLDFIERSLVSQMIDKRDIGVTVHGFWLGDAKDARVNYWLGGFNSPGNFHQTGGSPTNRWDDNDTKDFVARVLARPIWKMENWGSLELGWSSQFGKHGESGDASIQDFSGLNRRETWAIRHGAFASYEPAGPVRGWWMRGEWAWMKDRNIPLDVDQLNSDDRQDGPQPFAREGFYVSTGYKISKSRWADSAPKWFKPFEFKFRYEQFENIMVADSVDLNQTDTFATAVYSPAVTYYIKGNNAKITLQYNWSDEPDDDANDDERGFREVNNDSLQVMFQVAF